MYLENTIPLYDVNSQVRHRQMSESAIAMLIQRIRGGVHFKRYADGTVIVHRKSRRVKRTAGKPGHIVVRLSSKPRNISHIFVSVDKRSNALDKILGLMSPDDSMKKQKGEKIASSLIPVGPHRPEYSQQTRNSSNNDKIASSLVPIGPHPPQHVQTSGTDVKLPPAAGTTVTVPVSQRLGNNTSDLLNVVNKLMIKVRLIKN